MMHSTGQVVIGDSYCDMMQLKKYTLKLLEKMLLDGQVIAYSCILTSLEKLELYDMTVTEHPVFYDCDSIHRTANIMFGLLKNC